MRCVYESACGGLSTCASGYRGCVSSIALRGTSAVDDNVADDALLTPAEVARADELARRFGIDVTDVGFWAASLGVCRDRIDTFCSLAGG